MKKKLLILLGLYLVAVAILFVYAPIWIPAFLLLLAIIGMTLLYVVYRLNRLVKKTKWFTDGIPIIENYPTNEWYRIHEERNYDIVNIGSSSAKYAFDYSEMNIKAFNWAEQPQSLDNGFKILKTYFSILKKDGIVILSLGPFSGLDVNGKWAKDANDKYYYILDSYLIDNYSCVAFRRRYPLIAYPKQSLRELIKKILNKNVQRKTTDEFIDDSEKWMSEWCHEFNIDDIDAPISYENQKGKNKRIALLSEMIEFCIERTLKPIIVIPPVHPSLAVKFTGKFRENYIYSFIREANQKNVLFLDYIDDIRFGEDKLYRNSFCLNENGARLFTNILLKDTGLL